ncbi:MAG: succinate dehydrogenase, cytochrome b556 subunit [Chloroflexi bacterium]|nr:succinate dehydrogenase, cytochrome b556 subunit [Chloroflexota bacterium]
MSTLVLTLRESVRYRGRSGHWSWVAHRLSGLAILLFLIIHVWETANARYSPGLYAWSIAVFKYPPVAVGEIPLVGAVFYHAFNGIRISILDYKPELWKHQQKSAAIVWVLFAIIFIPIALFMLSEMGSHCSEVGPACWQFPRLADFGIGN